MTPYERANIERRKALIEALAVRYQAAQILAELPRDPAATVARRHAELLADLDWLRRKEKRQQITRGAA